MGTKGQKTLFVGSPHPPGTSSNNNKNTASHTSTPTPTHSLSLPHPLCDHRSRAGLLDAARSPSIPETISSAWSSTIVDKGSDSDGDDVKEEFGQRSKDLQDCRSFSPFFSPLIPPLSGKLDCPKIGLHHFISRWHVLRVILVGSPPATQQHLKGEFQHGQR